jgi:hypothetical protein
VAEPVAPGEQENADDADDRGDRVAEPLDLAQQRRFERTHFREQLIDAAEFGLASRRNDDAGGAPGDDHRAGEGHVLAVADRRLLGDRQDRLLRRHGLAGERRLLGAQVLGVDQAQIGRNPVAGLEQHDIARRQILGRNESRLAIANGARFRREHVADRIERLLRPALLQEA